MTAMKLAGKKFEGGAVEQRGGSQAGFCLPFLEKKKNLLGRSRIERLLHRPLHCIGPFAACLWHTLLLLVSSLEGGAKNEERRRKKRSLNMQQQLWRYKEGGFPEAGAPLKASSSSSLFSSFSSAFEKRLGAEI